MKLKNRLYTALALLLLVTTLFSCDNNRVKSDDTDSTASTETTKTTDVARALELNGVAISEYVVIYSKNSTLGGEKTFQYFNAALSALGEAELQKSTAIKDRYEILIGVDGGDATISAAYAKNPEGFIGVSGKKVFLSGVNYAAICQVIDAFFAKKDAGNRISVTANETLRLTKDSLTVTTYNLQADTSKAGRAKTCIADMAASITEISPDVFGTQENCTEIHTGLMKNLTGYSYYKGASLDSATNKGNYVYYKTAKFNLIENGFRYMSDTPKVKSKYDESNEYRGYSFVILESKETGKRFLFINLHADYRGSNKNETNGVVANTARLKQLKALSEFLKTYYEQNMPIVILGDFNAVDGHTSLETFKTDNPRLSETSVVAQEKGDTGGTLVTVGFTTRQNYIFDHIFVTPESLYTTYYTVEDNGNGKVYPSDHLPVVAKLSLY